ncbi:pyrroline-5-carboxylate reductase [Mycobacterium sp. URHB0021]|jgi:hypothetical protein
MSGIGIIGSGNMASAIGAMAVKGGLQLLLGVKAG